MKTKYFIIVAMLVFVILIFGCTQVKKDSELQDVTVALSWIHEAQFAGMYWADKKGYYADEGLNVTFVPYNDEDLPQVLADNKYDFAVLQADTLLLAREKGLPVKAVFTDYRYSPTVYFSKQSSGITKPEDLVGKTVGADYSEVYPLIAMLKNKGIDINSVKIVKRDYTYDKLASGEFDAEAGWITDGSTVEKTVGAYNVLHASDYNANFYSDIISTTERTITDNPALVQKFVSATQKGWQAAIENPDEAALLTLEYQSESEKSSQEHLKFVMQVSAPLINTGDSYLGYMDIISLNNTYNILLDQKILSSPFDVADSFTNEFVQGGGS
jgi:ABC-type nitrate/sulfonate/bicarbonate transport system substrate-binding protein